MTKMSYAEQIKHPLWQRKRLEALSRSDFTCECCGDKEKTLHVHHKQYIKGRKAWEYELSELDVLCEECHGSTHAVKENLAKVLGCKFHDIPGEWAAFGFFAGFLLPFHLVGEDLSMEGWKVCKPFFELGFMVAALGPGDLKDAIHRKVADGRLPADSPFLSMILDEEEGE